MKFSRILLPVQFPLRNFPKSRFELSFHLWSSILWKKTSLSISVLELRWVCVQEQSFLVQPHHSISLSLKFGFVLTSQFNGNRRMKKANQACMHGILKSYFLNLLCNILTHEFLSWDIFRINNIVIAHKQKHFHSFLCFKHYLCLTLQSATAAFAK